MNLFCFALFCWVFLRHVAAGCRHLSVLQQLLDLGASPSAVDPTRRTPLHWAVNSASASEPSFDAERLLLNARAETWYDLDDMFFWFENGWGNGTWIFGIVRPHPCFGFDEYNIVIISTAVCTGQVLLVPHLSGEGC